MTCIVSGCCRAAMATMLLLGLVLVAGPHACHAQELPGPIAEWAGKDFSGGAQHLFGADYYGKQGVNFVYAQPTGEPSRMQASFTLKQVPAHELAVQILGMDDDGPAECPVAIELNGKQLHRGPSGFSQAQWQTIEFAVPKDALRVGENQLVISNLSANGELGNIPWFMMARCLIAPPGYRAVRTPSEPRVKGDAGEPRLVGVAKIEITPTAPVLLSGYAGRQHQLTLDVSQKLWARAVVVGSDDEQPAVMVAVDNCGLSAAIQQQVAAALEKKLKLPPARLTLCSTHTHSAPMLTGVLNNLLIRDLTEREQAAIDAYTQELVGKLAEVVEQAWQARQACTLSWGTGKVTFAKNRRGGAVTDHAVPVLRAVNEKGQVTAVITNYACHCVSAGSGPNVCGDWAGYAAEGIEADNPGATAVVLIGCGADQNPSKMNSLAAAQGQGRMLADEVTRVLDQELTPIHGALATKRADVILPFAELPTREIWEARAKNQDIAGHHARRNLARLDRGEALPTELSYPIQSWQFGDNLAMVFLGGEVVVDYSLILRKRLDATRLWITAYANDVCCYIPSERILKEGGYEGGDAMVWYDRPAPLATGVEKLIVDEVVKQLGDPFLAANNQSLTGGTRALSPEESMAAMQTHDYLKVELVAAEPLVIDPVAIDFGHDGRLWVAEMHDYPEGLDGQYQPGGRIKYLQDIDQDGKYDKATVLLDQVAFPTGVKAWRDGVLVCTAPDVLFVADTDKDGRADVIRKVLTGFETHNYQARVNSLSLGLDNWIHGASGIFGGTIKTLDGQPVDANNRDFRMLPDDGVVEAVSGRTQQGRARDDWGNWFGCENSTLLTHYPLTEHYLLRNPLVAAPPATLGIAESNRLFPRGNLVQFALSGPAGVPTSACGMGIYRDTLLGADFSNNAFVCEPVNQLVHRMTLKPRGVSFTALRAADEQQQEILSSTDNWFRPVQAVGGPDGALYVVDMYRYMIEHPRFIAPEIRAQTDVRAGDTMGRIYRLVPREGTLNKVPQLSSLEAAGVVAALNSTNGTLRDMAHLELLWRKDQQAIAPLIELAQGAELPQVRLQALCALDGLKGLTVEVVAARLDDPHAEVRRHAVRLAEPWLDQDQQLAEKLVAMGIDDEPQVRLQVAYSLGEWNHKRSGKELIRFARAAGDDRYLRSAALSGLRPDNMAAAVDYLLADPAEAIELSSLGKELLNMAARTAEPAAQDAAMKHVLQKHEGAYATWQLAVAPELLAALKGSKGELSAARDADWQRILAQARDWLDDGDTAVERRVLATKLLPAAGGEAEDIDRLASGLLPQSPTPLQLAALESLAAIDAPHALNVLFAGIPQLTPAVQAAALDQILARENLTVELLSRLEKGELPRGHLDAGRRQALVNHPNAALKSRAEKLFAAPTSAEVAELLKKFQAVDPARGDRRLGKEVFVKHCAACHKVNELGHVVGPDLLALTDKSKAYLLTAMLDPNAAVDQRYASYTAVNADGQIFTGILAAEDGNSIVLKGQEGKSQQLLRSEIEQLQNSGKSLMPEDLTREIPPAAMEHLLAFLSSPATRAPESDVESVQEMARLLADAKIGTPDEYRVIPPVFTVAIAAGKRNDAAELTAILTFALPEGEEPLLDWQAVVLGGGVVNGLTQAGPWPGPRIVELLEKDEALAARWQRTLKLAEAMADRESVPTGTRYDALRLVAMLPWDQCQDQLLRYLAKGTNAELQQGAVSGLADIPHPEAAAALAGALGHLNDDLRNFAMAGLLRVDDHRSPILLAVEKKLLSADKLPADVKEKLLAHPEPDIRAQAKKVLNGGAAR